MKLSKHILICGWNENGAELVNSLQADRRRKAIVLIADLSENPCRHEDVGFVQGEVNEHTLELANAREAETALILGDPTIHDPYGRDAKTLMVSLMLKEHHPGIYTCLQLFDTRSLTHLEISRADEVVVVGTVAGGLLSRAVLDHGSSKAILSLLREEGDEIYCVTLPRSWIGKRFDEGLVLAKSQMQAILIAVEPAGEGFCLNPDADYVFKEGDKIAVIAEECPEEEG